MISSILAQALLASYESHYKVVAPQPDQPKQADRKGTSKFPHLTRRALTILALKKPVKQSWWGKCRDAMCEPTAEGLYQKGRSQRKLF